MTEDILKLVNSRCSIRNFESTPIPDEDIDKILKVGISAPSAGNRQPWRIVVTKDSKIRSKLSKAALGQEFVEEAPVVLTICAVPEESAARYEERGRTLYVLQDTAALTTNMLLAAHALGYGACWVGAFNEVLAKEALSIPDDHRPVAMIPIGKIKGKYPEKRSRRPLDEVIVNEHY